MKSISASDELDAKSTCSILEYMGNEGNQRYQTVFNNLDAVLLVGNIPPASAAFWKTKTCLQVPPNRHLYHGKSDYDFWGERVSAEDYDTI